MTQKKRNYLFYLEDMYDSMLRIQEYIEHLSLDEFSESSLVIDAVVRNLEIIGEASKHVPVSVKQKYPQLPWKQMYGLRNFIVHEYFGIDIEIIWKIISDELPQNAKDLEALIQTEK
ncbi:MAG: DUF86 domain-containing protein [Cyclonatronaceae bacterium]